MRTHDTCCASRTAPAELHPEARPRGCHPNQTGAVARGLDLQTTLAVNHGVALGVLRAAFDAPENPEEKGQPKPREDRKSFRWVEGLRVRGGGRAVG